MNLPFAPTTNTRRQLVVELDGGAGMLFKFNTGDPFIVPEPSAVVLLVVGGCATLLVRRRSGGS